MYYLGIDGGGTKTVFALADEQNNIIREATGAPTNPVDVGIDTAITVIGEGIEMLLDGISYHTVSIFAGIAGCMTGDNRERIRAYLNTLGLACADCGGDVQSVVAAGLGTSNGICAIMGTGSATFVQKNKKLLRFGGYGYLLDEGGNGYTIGRDAVLACLKAEEGSGEVTVLRELLLQEIKAPTVLAALSDFYVGGKKQLASYAPLVFEAYDNGDAVAKHILRRNMQCVAQGLRAAKSKMQATSPVRTVLAGGLTARADVLIPMIREQLEDETAYDITVLRQPPVMGALLLAGMPTEEA